MKLSGQVAIVTGGGRNIGEAICKACSENGAKVVVADIDEGRASEVADAINGEQPGSALAKVVDVSSQESVQRMVNETVAEWGHVDILVNNAAISDHSTILDLRESEWDNVMDVSLKGVFNCSQLVARQLVSQNHGGSIISMASTSGHRGRSNATAYTAAKAGILNLTRSMAIQLSPYRIRVNSITPNRVGSPVGLDKERTDSEVTNLVGRHGVPSDIANAVVFLASPDAGFITATDLLVDGGALATSEP